MSAEIAGELYRHWRYVLHFALRYLPEDEAEDVVQEAMIDAWRTYGKWQGRGHLRTWLCGIAKHKVGDYRRRLRSDSRNIRNVVAEQGLVPVLADYDAPAFRCEADARFELRPPLSGSSETEEQAIAQERREAIAQALQAIPLHYREALEQRYLRGMPVDDMAQRAGVTRKGMENRLIRAKQAFRLAYAE